MRCLPLISFKHTLLEDTAPDECAKELSNNNDDPNDVAQHDDDSRIVSAATFS